MAKCRLCNADIPDGTEYCKECLDKNNTKQKEAYLDSLLSSVKDTAPADQSVFIRKERKVNSDMINQEGTSSEIDPEVQNQRVTPQESPQNISDEEKATHDESENSISDEEKSDPNEISEEEAFDIDINALGDFSEGTDSTSDVTSSAPIHANDKDMSDMDDDGTDSYLRDLLNELDIKGTDDTDSEVSDVWLGDEIVQSDAAEEPFVADGTKEDKAEDIKQLSSEKESADDTKEAHASDDAKQQDQEDEEILNLLNQISENDPVADDVHAISRLLSGKGDPKQEENVPGDVGEVFSDALKVVTTLKDPSADATDSSEGLPEKNTKDKAEKKKLKIENLKKEKVDLEKSEEEKLKKEKPKKEKGTRFKRKKKDKDKSKDETEKKVKNKGKNKAKAKEEGTGQQADENLKDAKKAEDIEAVNSKPSEKVKKKPKSLLSKDQSKEDTSDNKENLTEEKKAGKAEKRKEKREKKKKDTEIMQTIEEIDEDGGKLNRFGVSFTFLFFGILVIVLLIGTNIFSYTLSIKNATNYFDHHKYTEAYDEVYGIDVKDEDIVIYNKIMTVMYVNKQLNSYNNYYAIGEYPQALDSLLKGLKRYDKYIELATMLGIKSDLDYVRSQILAELKNEFKLSEKDALRIINSENQSQYSVRVYDTVLENMNN